MVSPAFEIGPYSPYQLGMLIYLAVIFVFTIYMMAFMPEWPEKLFTKLFGRKKKKD